ncbi:thiamine diphosphokinase [Paenibacillus sp. NEAU-GSW1]|uniref:thiamine diphosphokinase n=1 Tax=Paenibacillus sp. NEAU-GSW1 TaxID=2682486 RepID=UPI0012E274FC|nr:thiamine diphosphokinase [Paenibacillus sp. NEAU-GSW1]MUT67351.1 thiamine diphosphokinase [Paenibacillus sp. NEAU-GSW1]
MIKRIMIFTGGRLGEWAAKLVKPDDMLIGADSGAFYLISHQLKPHTAIGDFDSVTAEQLEQIRSTSTETIECDPIDKDYTDTEMAFRLALERKPAEIVLTGALGTRFDHSLANVHLLSLALEQGIAAAIVDEHNTIRLAQGPAEVRLTKGEYSHVSLLPLSERVAGITLDGFKYPLHNAVLRIGQSLGISNIIEQQTGSIAFSDGVLLIIQSKD